MAIVLEANYSKKLGLPQYSSHQYSVTVRTEVQDLNQVEDASSRLYQQLQEAVDRDIQNPGFLPGAESPPPQGKTFQRGGVNAAPPNRNEGNRSWPTTPSNWGCSDKQRELINKLMRENGIEQDEVETMARQLFSKDLGMLNKLEASGVIDELFAACHAKQGTKKGGRR